MAASGIVVRSIVYCPSGDNREKLRPKARPFAHLDATTLRRPRRATPEKGPRP